MSKNLFLMMLVALFAVGSGIAQQPGLKMTIAVTKTSPTSGREMFTSYCAPCHGMDGRGHGPMAAALRTPPVNLTELGSRNHGVFPELHLVSVLEFGASGPKNGVTEMPVWGPILSKMNITGDQGKELRIRNLSRYIDEMQVR